MIRGVEIMKRPLKSFLFFRYSASLKCLDGEEFIIFCTLVPFS